MAGQDKPRRYDLDPRPDLAEDHRQWVVVLAIAWYKDRQLHGDLHGFRCAGARLERMRGRNGREFLKLNYEALLTTWDKVQLVKGWLEPNKAGMKDVFDRATLELNAVAAEAARKAG